MKEKQQWEAMGAASGLFATLPFVIAFIIVLGTDPGGGQSALPDISHAEAAPAFFAFHLNAIRAPVLLNALGLALFLWFLGSPWAVLRRAEGGPVRGSAIASAGALVGVATTLVGLVSSWIPRRSRTARPWQTSCRRSASRRCSPSRYVSSGLVRPQGSWALIVKRGHR